CIGCRFNGAEVRFSNRNPYEGAHAPGGVVREVSMPPSPRSSGGSPASDRGQPNPKGRASPDLTLHPNRAPEQLQEALDNVEPEPAATIRARRGAIDLAKRLENERVGFHRDANAGVAHPDRYPPLLGPRPHLHAPHLSELHRVANQILEDDLELA